MNLKAFLQVVLICCIVSCGEHMDLKTINDFSLRFVNVDGTEIVDNECIVPEGKYAIAIKGYKNVLEEGVLNYSINGVVYKTKFMIDETQLIPIILKDGVNTVRLLEVNISANLYFPIRGEFKLVN